MIKTQYGHHVPEHPAAPAHYAPPAPPSAPVGAQATSSKEKIPPPEPPLRIVHTEMETGRVKQVYHRVGFLGEVRKAWKGSS